MVSARWLVVLCAAPACVAQSELQLSQIKRQMADHLSRAANFTCLETIHRSKSDRIGRMQKNDTLRLEVAFVDGKELFSWLGAGKFEDRGIGEFGRGGAIGSGLFASLAQSVFLTKRPTFRYAGEESVSGRRAVRYTYQVPLQGSGYEIKIGAKHALVGFSGSFWADADSLQVMRLSVRADDIPLTLGIYGAVQTIEYTRVRLSETDFLLPQSAETTISELSGGESRNRTEFSHWLRYESESTLVFEGAPSSSSKPDTKIELPPGLVLSAHLDTEIRSERALVGDRIAATVDQDAKWKGDLFVPSGSTLTGRIRSIEKPADPSGNSTIALEFSELQIGNRRVRFFARLSEGKSTSSEVRKVTAGDLLGVGELQIRGDRFHLTRELHLIWKIPVLLNR
jgi:hypothetical protein